MMHRRTRLLAGLLLAAGVLTVLVSQRRLVAETPPPAEKPVAFSAEDVAFYEKEILPILKQNCYKCHGDGKERGNFSMENRERFLKGGDLGPAVLLDKLRDSNFLKAIEYRDGLEMPPSGKLPADKIAKLTEWANRKLPFPANALVAAASKSTRGKVTDEDRKYWAYQPVKPQPIPAVKQADWIQNPIDAFILAKLEAKGLKPNPPADKLSLVRRLYYDLTGLPPTPEQIDAFVNDNSPNAYERLVDALLASPHYGEKWGRHWLDLVHYAETNGYERDGPKPNVWRYRDYVIKSFNDDKPFDQFIREQLAGDEIDRNKPENMIATGFYRIGLWDDEPADYPQAVADEFDEIVATTSQVFLGMTMNCARCHDHKIDPMPQTDYYALKAFFVDISRYSDTRDVSSPNNLADITPKEFRELTPQEREERENRKMKLRGEITKLEDQVIKRMPAPLQRASEGDERPKVIREQLPKFIQREEQRQLDRLRRDLDRISRAPSPRQELALAVNRANPFPPPTHVHLRGNAHAQGPIVEPAFPTVLGFPKPKLPEVKRDAKSSGRRTVLANWIASKENPLTARVFVNRLWQHHFGKGIVPSSNDFGKIGEAPTHPELLDYLAQQFMDANWSVKKMHKLMLMSSTYQQSSKGEPKALQVDPANQLLWRFPMRRLIAEEVRDSILAVSGSLNAQMFGPSIYPPIPREVLAGQSVPGQGWHTSPPEQANRRSVYVHIKRSLQVPILIQHDQADPDTSCPVRYTTTVPTQALGMLNGEFTNQQAQSLAERVLKDEPKDRNAQICRVIRLTVGRAPTAEEVAADAAFLDKLQQEFKLNAAEAFRQYCLMAINSNEFIYLD
ncbi:PSD1 and planctomycete cytochrome C domain-containing protein [Tuwongella immobilis]|uniref:Cytochrome c domain-containing protein n=1 Tax=Tuwongella immobilis TaxID=692036 RepID=A0A6C2YVF0_9BACT|nr:PSD1 and planctomycete cytochrome C domain-containing protein [Tuwongella immobilis]VIP04885.1 signal peptide protein : Uncharacterized protein OS=Isosphaera pallida (strain ATCC 43644 / DSM 9630 / IS1B) GN=Isop_2381 PE=4 SV=1: PSCyt1: PSCyt2: PSD1 [Tuwongella immobilis]VTS07129.1 signal peptide protein : Uncharacterized protein OS=Isosphaera pallida (strain ATCC 43644 / DSM 9630 / IS1B) GN=Isop_2381 PE=4 SV=1: PSCyt1: PSCyt2: PSD1 [Tuwongella immobilis]